jgi:hypothetical protein
VERSHFNSLLDNYTSLTSDEANELIQLSHDFPYCQSIHNLAARAAQDNNLSEKGKLLNVSAMYSCDRSALKATMTAPSKTRIQPSVVIEKSEPQDFTPTISTTLSNQDNETLRQQILSDIALMHESKRLYEEVIAKMDGHEPIPLAKPLAEEVKEPKVVLVDETNEGLIEEIKSSKKKIKPETTKQIEQIEIIDQFIKTQPIIARPKAASSTIPNNDLSESGDVFGENIISETLVEILLKQGKREKAIEILKKLIWKYPQKKAYFAAQIEDLRK